jgi:hypothetical protein
MLTVSKMIIQVHKVISRFKKKAKTLANGWKVVSKQPKDDGVDAIYVQKASIQVASILFNNSPIACNNSNK